MLNYLVFCAILTCATSQKDLHLLSSARNTFQYLKEQNYAYENHTVVTQDGYRLLLVRIPYNRNESPSDVIKPPILFVHGILCAFSDFLVGGPGQSIGFRAVEKGYDAFFLNTRGNRWSRNHTTLDPDHNANAFWNFSWHEVGIYDIAATIDYIINITGHSKVSYVGHSQATTAFLALASTRPDYNEKLKVAILLAPVSYLKNAKFLPLRLLRNIARPVQSIVCAYLTNYPVGCSAKELLHFLQNAHSSKFRLYDYGKKDNLLEYGQTTPPDYKLSAITTPVALYYGTNDYYIALTDVAKLVDNLPNIIRNVAIGAVTTNHLDVLVGTLVEQLVTQPVFQVLNEYNNL